MTHSVDEAELRALIRSGEARDIRERNDVPRSAVSSDLGVHWDTVRKWERGDRIPRGDTARRYLRLLRQLRKFESSKA